MGCIDATDPQDLLAGAADPDGGPTMILEAPDIDSASFFGIESSGCSCRELQPDEPILTLVSLNAKTAATVEFTRSAWAGARGIEISCGRAASNNVVLQDPRVSVHHFTIRVAVPGIGLNPHAPHDARPVAVAASGVISSSDSADNKSSSNSQNRESGSPGNRTCTEGLMQKCSACSPVEADVHMNTDCTAGSADVHPGVGPTHPTTVCSADTWASARSSTSTAAVLEIRDDSSNGTWVNDKMVGKDRWTLLAAGDRIFVLPSARVGQLSAIGYAVVLADAVSRSAPRTLGASCPAGDRATGSITATGEAPANRGGEPSHTETTSVHAGQLAASMQCGLCGEAPVHRCATAVPCGHNFDLGCLLAWRHKSRNCPCCNDPVRQIVRNRGVDRMAETFLQSKPEAARDDLTVRLLDASENDPRNEVMLMRLLHGVPVPSSMSSRGIADPPAQRAECLPDHLAHLAPFLAAARKTPSTPSETRQTSAGVTVGRRPAVSSQVYSAVCVIC